MIILGSTGSIGINALKIAKQFNIKVEALVCGSNALLLNEQIKEFSPKFVGIYDSNALQFLQARDSHVYTGNEQICTMLEKCQSQRVLNAVVGFAGLPFSLKALHLNKKLILANKESLVVAGALIQEIIQKQNKAKTNTTNNHITPIPNAKANILDKIFPIDSEHFSLWYLLTEQSLTKESAYTLYITASGGALRDMPIEQIKYATLQDVLKHPTWNMGKKITIDSATFINKLYETLETYWLFNTTNIHAMIERSSLVHALIEYPNGIFCALTSHNDMCLPIAYGMDYLQAKNNFHIQKLQAKDFTKIRFQDIDTNRYPLWRYKDLLLENPNLGIVLNASNEILQNLFLQEQIPFNAFNEIISQTLDYFTRIKMPISRLEEIHKLREETTAFVYFLLKNSYKDSKIC
ncbi:1-deoxy-D-xylulose-5-phosphate reductoisomerase [Helicobacter aurati]|uniref:1-deoxy-D-xylulose 5-phosphate reductoisomerase n=1 Tax=Helicobacter aurati TaxID=137778 RepID=A0A3D8JA89_9HELI|nr:1-deoxy-D-xylulose-5-phosphate reductoisomerase [Helicobacter aurati]RDU73794.1 1-deoxy-D-xylulose-5-phosphate reductoisomerase [Helicobacter aurati]